MPAAIGILLTSSVIHEKCCITEDITRNLLKWKTLIVWEFFKDLSKMFSGIPMDRIVSDPERDIVSLSYVIKFFVKYLKIVQNIHT